VSCMSFRPSILTATHIEPDCGRLKAIKKELCPLEPVSLGASNPGIDLMILVGCFVTI
jgi:hypothetical protein